jgi:hypothetical protein
LATKFKADLNIRYWHYQQSNYPDVEKFFEHPLGLNGHPPVFLPSESWRNVIINPIANQQEINELLALVPDGEKHKWFRSMNSSQALAQSVLGNLKINNTLHYLSTIKDDSGLDLFGNAELSSDNLTLEYKVDYLGEPRSTSLDGYITGDYRIAIECKFTEAEIGTCSRPRLTPNNSNYEKDYCNGTFSIQKRRNERCSLTEVGVLYWRYVSDLFNWKNDADLNPCLLYKNYQLVRNLLAVGVKSDGSVSVNNGHAVLIYDERNPAFQKGGDCDIVYSETKNALRESKMLRKCSWQRIIRLLRDQNILPWLTQNLEFKYGF